MPGRPAMAETGARRIASHISDNLLSDQLPCGSQSLEGIQCVND
jgi:hypothetical protein